MSRICFACCSGISARIKGGDELFDRFGNAGYGTLYRSPQFSFCDFFETAALLAALKAIYARAANGDIGKGPLNVIGHLLLPTISASASIFLASRIRRLIAAAGS